MYPHQFVSREAQKGPPARQRQFQADSMSASLAFNLPARIFSTIV
jgi:hypothetical protein